MVDCFSPTVPSFFLSERKKSKKRENINFLLVRFKFFSEFTSVFWGIKMDVNIVCTLLLTGKHDLSIS